VDPTAGITVTACTPTRKHQCPKPVLEVNLTDGSQEPNPLDLNDDGSMKGETITAAFFSTLVKPNRDTSRLYDETGQVPGSGVVLSATETGDSVLWIVVRDSRDGATWMSVNVHAVPE
jgi:hypothetical protein